jgi:hypothetical protein
MVEALAPHGADEPFRNRILPRTARRRENFRDAHALDTMAERLAEDAVAIAEKIGRPCVVREGLHELLGRPLRGRVLDHVDVDDPSVVVAEHDEDKEHPQAGGGDREEIDGDQVPDVVGEERGARSGTAGCAARFGPVKALLRELSAAESGSEVAGYLTAWTRSSTTTAWGGNFWRPGDGSFKTGWVCTFPGAGL